MSSKIENIELIEYQTRYIGFPLLFLIFFICILQLLLVNIDIKIGNTVILDLFDNMFVFNVSFVLILLITIYGSIILIYFQWRWSVIFSMQSSLEKEQRALLKRINKKKQKISRYKEEIKDMVHVLNMSNYGNNKLEFVSEKLFTFKNELLLFQKMYQERTKRKIFKNYVKEISHSTDEIEQIVNENQLAILTSLLCEIRVNDEFEEKKKRYLTINDYNDYLKNVNLKVVNEFNFYGGYYGMNSNSNKNVVDIIKFEELIEKVIDNIDENQYTFVNY